jgi:hypothetical protein
LNNKKKREVLSGGEVQGPINREPDDKLDKSEQQQQQQSTGGGGNSSGGIRRLYVIDSTNLLIFVIVCLESTILSLERSSETVMSWHEERKEAVVEASSAIVCVPCASLDVSEAAVPKGAASPLVVVVVDEPRDSSCVRSCLNVFLDSSCFTLFWLLFNMLFIFMCLFDDANLLLAGLFDLLKRTLLLALVAVAFARIILTRSKMKIKRVSFFSPKKQQ